MPAASRDRFRGCLLGLAIGDAVGARFEGKSVELIRACYPTISSLMSDSVNELRYTDDTQMALGVAETLLAGGDLREESLCAALVANYQASRNYGRGERVVLEAMATGLSHQGVAKRLFPGGCNGNGAASRAAPVGLFFRGDEARVWDEARRSALPTHVHPLAVEGAQLMALAVSLAVSADKLDREAFFDRLEAACASPEYRDKLRQGRQVKRRVDLEAMGRGREAVESVPTAIASFAYRPDSYTDAVGNAIILGGDTDTLGAMAGALSGAYLGASGVPARLVAMLEATPKGRTYIIDLATRLHHAAALAEPAGKGPKPPATLRESTR